MSLWPKTREQLNEIVNRHFDTPEYHQLFSVRAHAGAAEDLGYPLPALHQEPARLLGCGGGACAAGREARYLGA